jgi:hypothetical protein
MALGVCIYLGLFLDLVGKGSCDGNKLIGRKSFFGNVATTNLSSFLVNISAP